MINIALVLVESIICYIVFTLLFKKYKTDGIYVFAIIATFIACVMNLKTISIMNKNATVGKRTFYGTHLENKDDMVKRFGETAFY